jgi:predicted Zn-dependent protease
MTDKPSSPPAGVAFDEALRLLLTLDERKPHRALPRRLDALFADLSRLTPGRPVHEIEDTIWALWTNHDDPVLDRRMEQAIAAMAMRKLDVARPLLDQLVMDAPDWAEAWNKRATLSFIEARDAESVADIIETLSREPRHFGAMSGFGQICLRQGRVREAMVAFDVALMVNPHLHGVQETVMALRKREAGKLN